MPSLGVFGKGGRKKVILQEKIMIESNECSEFLNERVGVGVNNFLNGGLFYYYGQLLEVTEEYVKIRMSTGYKQIQLDEIIEIKRARP